MEKIISEVPPESEIFSPGLYINGRANPAFCIVVHKIPSLKSTKIWKCVRKSLALARPLPRSRGDIAGKKIS